jgi:arylsulfatase A-like enzyme
MKPNILLINCDDLGYGDLGCFGSTCNHTPNIDRLAAEGMRFTDFYVASPVCSASRAALMTGCYPNRVGFHEQPVLFPGAQRGLDPDEKTIARYLKDAGYATKMVGKWHCGDQPEFLPTAHGFDEYFGLPFSNDMGRQVNHPDGFPLPLLRNDEVVQQQPDQRGLTESYTRECVDFIDQHRDEPFFLYLAHMYVHVPLFVPKPFLEASENGAYGGAVACIDWSTGVLVERLRSLGLLENTLILFTSDNGSRARDEGGSNAPCRGTKGTTWEGGQRVPLIAHWPKTITPGQTASSVARSFDLLPTLCSIAGTTPDPDRVIDGVDLHEVLTQGGEGPDVEMAYYVGPRLNALRQGKWKLHVGYGTHWQPEENPEPALYNLFDDPGEERNVITEYPEVVERLTERMAEIRQDLGDSIEEIKGEGCRPVGWKEDAKPLTTYDPEHPYLIAMYDQADMATMSG